MMYFKNVLDILTNVPKRITALIGSMWRLTAMVTDVIMFTHVLVHIRHPPNGFAQKLPLTYLPHQCNIMPSCRQSSKKLLKDAVAKAINNMLTISVIVCCC